MRESLERLLNLVLMEVNIFVAYLSFIEAFGLVKLL